VSDASLASTDLPHLPHGDARPRRLTRHQPEPWFLITSSTIVALVLLAPLVFLLIEATGAGVAQVAHLIWRPLTVTLLWNTVRLTVAVTTLSAIIGTMCAWFVERTDLPGRRMWAVLVVIPFAIPDFVVSFGWASLFTWVHGFYGAVLVMTLAVYPLVYLPVAASLRSADPGLEEVARSLGLTKVSTFFRVTLAHSRAAIFGGCVLVSLVILAEYGAFEILGYQTFTTEIFTEFTVGFNIPTACALSIVLIVISAVILTGDWLLRPKGRLTRTGPMAQQAARRHRLGHARWPALCGFTVLVGLALGVPIGSSIYWMVRGTSSGLLGNSLLNATLYTALYSACAALISTVAAIPVAMLAVRYDRMRARLLERSTYLVLAMPGLVIALALSYFTERYLDSFGYQSAPLLILAYSILFFPLALVGVRASVAYAPVEFEEAARSLGQSRLATHFRVTLKIIGPGLAASFCLVFLAAVTELTATLLLVPIGVQTLSTQFWNYETNLSYGQAAPFALAIIVIACVPSYIVSRYFDRLPTKATRQA
jgi:iron(III) transport system permease protein